LVAAVSLYLLLPTLLSVFGSWRSLSHLEWDFAIPIFAAEGASYVCLWALDRIALGTSGWFAIACAQLAGNAVGRFVPGAPTPFTVEMLRKAGVDTGEAAAFTASTSLQLGTTAALPLLALPAIIGGTPVSHSLVAAAYLGIGVLLVLVAAGTAAFASDTPLEFAGRGIQWLLNATVRRRHQVVGLPQELLADRDFIRTTLGGRGEHGVRLSRAAVRAASGRGRAAGAAAVHAWRPWFRRGGAGRDAYARRRARVRRAGRDAAVPAGRLLAPDSRRRRGVPLVPPALPLKATSWTASRLRAVWSFLRLR
jgi:hypothetical protein